MKRLLFCLLFIVPSVIYSQNVNEKLMIAAENGVMETVNSLIKSGADVNASNDEGITPIMAAARRGNYDVVQTLLDAGAYLFWKDKDGLIALDYAVESGDSRTLSLIQKSLPNDPVAKEKKWNNSYPTEITTPEFKVLDINWDKGFVAFRHVYRIREEKYQDFVNGELVWMIEDSVAECNYAGLDKYPPGSGIILGVYDLNQDEYLKTFTVCASVSKKADCMTHEESAKVLNEAKAYFLSQELDIYKNPDFFKMNNKVNLAPEHLLLMERCCRKIDSSVGMFSATELHANDDPIYIRIHEDSFSNNSGGSIDFLSVYRLQDRIILLEKFSHFAVGEIPVETEEYFFSPIIELPIQK